MVEKNLYSPEWPKEEMVEKAVETAGKPEAKDAKRGWVMDQIVLIGQVEAAMGHTDERISDIWQDLNGMDLNEESSQGLVEELSSLYELEKLLYALRVEAENQIFDAFPLADRTKWCLVKHLAMSYAVACENFHARACCPEAEQVMLKTGEAVTMASAMAFRFEPFGCFRCLSEAINQNDASN